MSNLADGLVKMMVIRGALLFCAGGLFVGSIFGIGHYVMKKKTPMQKFQACATDILDKAGAKMEGRPVFVLGDMIVSGTNEDVRKDYALQGGTITVMNKGQVTAKKFDALSPEDPDRAVMGALKGCYQVNLAQ